MLKVFTEENSRLNYHKKIIKKITTTLSPLPKEFWDTKPIVSGSYAVHLLFKPLTAYDDIDIYFETKQDYLRCKQLLDNFLLNQIDSATKSIAKNSITYIYSFAKIQLINKVFTTPEKLIYDHDMKNVSLAIQNNEIYIDDEVFNLFYNDKLSIRSTQITDNMSNKTKMIKIANLCNRIKKYISRYELTLDEQSKKIVEELVAFLKSQPHQLKKTTYVESNIYYNLSYNDCQNNLVSILHIEGALRQLVINPTETFFNDESLTVDF